MDVQEKFDLVTRNVAEIIGREDLMTLLQEKEEPSCYVITSYSIHYTKLYDPQIRCCCVVCAGNDPAS